jgi:hypothetical protein
MADVETSDGAAKPDTAWRDRLEEHEKSVNAMFLALAGGLLAFSTDQVKEPALLDPADRVLIAIAAVSAAASLAAGVGRSWLRGRLYRAKLAEFDEKDYLALGEKLDKVAAAHDARIEQGARELIAQTASASPSEREEALTRYYSENPDSERLKLKILLSRAEAVRGMLRGQIAFDRIARLGGVQLGTFLVGALSLAVLVFFRLSS